MQFLSIWYGSFLCCVSAELTFFQRINTLLFRLPALLCRIPCPVNLEFWSVSHRWSVVALCRKHSHAGSLAKSFASAVVASLCLSFGHRCCACADMQTVPETPRLACCRARYVLRWCGNFCRHRTVVAWPHLEPDPKSSSTFGHRLSFCENTPFEGRQNSFFSLPCFPPFSSKSSIQ